MNSRHVAEGARRVRALVWALWLATAQFLVAGPSCADQAAAANKALAEQLFETAREALAEGRYGEACQQLAESERIDRATGTLLNLAICHELEGRLASAWADYRETVALATKEGDTARRSIAEERIRLLTPQLSYLTLIAPAEHAADIVVSLDGASLNAPSLGLPFPIDPGTHAIRVQGAGRQPWVSEIRIGPAPERQVVRLPWPAAVPAPPRATPVHDAHAERDGSRRLLRQLGIGSLGLAVLAAGAGGYFGLRAANEWHDRNRHCPRNGCDAAAVDAWRRARQYALWSDVAFGVSLLTAATGTYLLVISRGAGDHRFAGIAVGGSL